MASFSRKYFVISRNCCFSRCLFGEGKNLLDVLGKGKGQWALFGGDGEAEFPKSVEVVVRLLESEAKNARLRRCRQGSAMPKMAVWFLPTSGEIAQPAFGPPGLPSMALATS